MILSCVLSSNAAIAAARFDYDYPAGAKVLETSNKQKSSVKEFAALELIQSAKYLMINGELDKAKLLLKEATLSTDFSKKTQLRYLAMIHFIEGNYQLAANIFERKDIQGFTGKGRYCTLNVLTLLILDKTTKAKSEYKLCRELIVGQASSSLLWLDTLVDLKLNPLKVDTNKIFESVFVENLNGDNLRIYLKLALYLNKQNLVIPRFQYFSEETLSNPLFRELIGMNYYRNLDLVKAYQVMESSNDPNSEVFKGNILLLQNKFEAAYAQYKLALKAKDNSTNALERLIPLAWDLEQWSDGIHFIEKFKFTKAQELEQLSLKAAFLTMQNKPEKIDTILKQINVYTKKGDPIEVTQLKTLNSINKNQIPELEFNAYKSCLKKDGLHCWLLFSLVNWDEAPELLKQDLPIHPSGLESYKSLMVSVAKTPLTEEVFIDQKDIEELDNELIELLETPEL